MPEENTSHDDTARRSREAKVPFRTYVLWILIIGLIPLIMIFRNSATRQGDRLRQHEFMQKLANDLIARATITLDPQSPYLRDIRGWYFKTDVQGNKLIENGEHVEVRFYAAVYLTDQSLQQVLTNPKFTVKRPNVLLISLIWSLGPILLVAVLIYWIFIRQLKGLARKGWNFGQATGWVVSPEKSTTQANPIVHFDLEIMGGTPVFIGTRVPLQVLIDALKCGESIDHFLNAFPSVKREQVIGVIEAGKLKVLESVNNTRPQSK